MSILDDARVGMDPATRPQDDLFGHVNGRWLAEEEIPSDRSSWGPFVQLADVAEGHVRDIIESLAAATASGSGPSDAADAEDARK
ncbi:MAG: peptidase M13, partial [Nocardioides sp.]